MIQKDIQEDLAVIDILRLIGVVRRVNQMKVQFKNLCDEEQWAVAAKSANKVRHGVREVIDQLMDKAASGKEGERRREQLAECREEALDLILDCRDNALKLVNLEKEFAAEQAGDDKKVGAHKGNFFLKGVYEPLDQIVQEWREMESVSQR